MSTPFKIQAIYWDDDNRFWSDDYSVTISGTMMKTMKLTSSTTSSFRLIPDSNNQFKLIVSCALGVYLQWQASSDNSHVSLTPSTLKGDADISKLDNPQLRFKFKTINNDDQFTLRTATGIYLTETGKSPPYIDGQTTLSSAAVFTFANP